MSYLNKQLIINLLKHPDGYTVDFIHTEDLNNHANKKGKTSKNRKSASKIPNRLIKQIGIPENRSEPVRVNVELPPPPPLQPIITHDEKPAKEPEEEQCFFEVEREIDLPETPALWFDKDKIHPREKQAMKDFFTPGSYLTADLYLKYRNFIVEAYRKNPNRYLTKIACRRVLRGDVNVINRMHEFLQSEGIINIVVSMEGNYSFKPNSLNKTSELLPKPQNTVKKVPENDDELSEAPTDADNLTLNMIHKSFSRTLRVYCQQCKLICGTVWYVPKQEFQEKEELFKHVCYDCYHHKLDKELMGNFVATDIAAKIQSTLQKEQKDQKSLSKGNWSIDDNIKLLNYLGKGLNNWEELLRQFQGKRSVEDVMMQFLQFPISNFKYQQEQKKIVPEKLEYPHQEYVALLESLCPIREPKKEEQEDKEEQMGEQEKERKGNSEVKQEQEQSEESQGKLQELVRLLVLKYSNKIQQLTGRERVVDEIDYYSYHQEIIPSSNNIGQQQPHSEDI